MKNPFQTVFRILLLFSLLLLLVSCGDTAVEESPVTMRTQSVPTGETLKTEEDILLRIPDDVYLDDTETGDDGTAGGTQSSGKGNSGETRISFVAVGDNILHSAVIADGAAHADKESGEEYNFNYIYDNVRDTISGADIAFVNQETPMGGKELGYYGYPNFNGPQEAGDALVNCGFDVVCIATNHMADMKDAGLSGTIAYWKSQPVTLIGGYTSAEDYEIIRTHEYAGIRIGFLAYTYGTNGMSVSTTSGLVIPLIDEDDIRRQVAKAKEENDLVFVNMHWGTDSSFDVTAEQKQYAQLLADLGVDVVIGEHPHVLQPMEWLTGENGNKTLVTYSIGNFVSTMYNDYFMVGGMLSLDIVKNGNSAYVENVKLIPTMTYYDMNRENLAVYFLDDFTEELAASHGSNVYGTVTLAKLRSYVTNAIPLEFLPESYQNP